MVTTDIQTFYGKVIVSSNLSVNSNTVHVDSTSGRVGIGKTNPAYSLDIAGIVNTTNIFQGGEVYENDPWLNTDSNLYYITDNVGIISSNPQKQLEVAGTLRFSNVSNSVNDIHTYTTYINTTTQYSSASGGEFGKSIAVSDDGYTMIVGAPGYQSSRGYADIYTKSGSTWSQQARLTYSLQGGGDKFGWSVAISSDGTTAVVGAEGENKAFVFLKPGGGWVDATEDVILTTLVAMVRFGWSVGISGNGDTIFVGDDGWSSNRGHVYLYVKPGGGWATTSSQDAILSASNLGSGDYFGRALAISSDGSTVVAGAYREDTDATDAGAAYIYVKPGGGWADATQTQFIQSSIHNSSYYFGSSVGISTDGSTIIVGAEQDGINGTRNGAAYIFTESGGSWSQAATLTHSDPSRRDDYFGTAVAISQDGTLAAVCSPPLGNVYKFVKPGGGWADATEDEIITGVGAYSVYIEGNVLIVGDMDYSKVYEILTNVPQGVLQFNTRVAAAGNITSFTGQHICFPYGQMKRGLIVSANNNKYVSLNGTLTTGLGAIKSSESLPIVSLSNVAYDRNVFGVVHEIEDMDATIRTSDMGGIIIKASKELGDTRVTVNSIGEGALWVVNTNGPLVAGDYITTSNIMGYGQKQESDELKNYTVAKITMDCDFNPPVQSVQIVKTDENGINVLDEYGRLQWEDTTKLETPYDIRYLTNDGTRTNSANAIWIAAYVGCTYHCG